jgi:hypothetical protein
MDTYSSVRGIIFTNADTIRGGLFLEPFDFFIDEIKGYPVKER